jgi:hypothetical protein
VVGKIFIDRRARVHRSSHADADLLAGRDIEHRA